VVLSSQTEITAEKGYNFWFHSSIELNVLHELPDAVVVVVPTEFLFGEEHGLPRETKTTAKKGYNFYQTVGSRSNFYSSFRMLFPLKYE